MPVPYAGQTFSSKQEPREFYNSYVKRIGFSIRTSCTRLPGVTREQNKVQFVCNREGRGSKPKEDQAAAESDDSNFDDDCCRCPDPGAWIPTSKCCVFPRPR